MIDEGDDDDCTTNEGEEKGMQYKDPEATDLGKSQLFRTAFK